MFVFFYSGLNLSTLVRLQFFFAVPWLFFFSAAWLQGEGRGSMNLLLSGDREGPATAGRAERQGVGWGFGFHAGEKNETLGGYISLISCYSNQSLDFQVPGLWQSSFFVCVFSPFSIGNRE